MLRLVDHIPLADLADSLEADTSHPPLSVAAVDATVVCAVARESLRVDGTSVETVSYAPVTKDRRGEAIASANGFEMEIGVQIPQEQVV